MIPKIIHYCWFGGGKKSELIESCISTWEQHLGDYKIIEWNETNTDLNNPFIQKAYGMKKWAFVADYVRLFKLKEYGGIYLDTDMLVLKNFDILLNSKVFFGSEDNNYISCGVIGAEPNSPFIAKCLDFYDSFKSDTEINLNTIPIPIIITEIFRCEFCFDKEFIQIINLKNITIYPSDYFYPLPNIKRKDIKNYKNYLTKNSFAVHLWNASWVEYSEFDYIKERNYFKGLKMVVTNGIVHKKFNYLYFRKILSSLKASLINK